MSDTEFVEVFRWARWHDDGYIESPFLLPRSELPLDAKVGESILVPRADIDANERYYPSAPVV